MTTITDGDLSRALLLLPSPLFRNRDIYDVSVDLGFHRSKGQSLWNALIKRGWIVRTAVPIFSVSARQFYWERTPNTKGAT